MNLFFSLSNFLRNFHLFIKGNGQVMRIPMNLTATIPLGSRATGQVTINFLSASKKSACVSITNIELRK